MTQVVDYSFARPGAAAIRSAGYAGAIRYLSPPPNEKNLDAGERDDLLAAGLAIGLVWETTETRPREGYDAGRADATRANEMADEFGAPSTVAIYYAVDRIDTTPDMVADYFRGVVDVGHRPAGVYGSQRVVEAMLDIGCRYGWQVETWGDVVSPRAHLVQLPNERAKVSGCDVNGVLADDWGQWMTPVAGLDHLHPVFADRVAAACRARGTSVYSGARSTQEQAELYRRYQAGTGNPANPPGSSWHEYGPDLIGGPLAMAVDFAEPYPHGEPGLIFPVAGEPWHGQPSEIPETARVAGADQRLPNPAPTTPTEDDDMRYRYNLPGEDAVHITDLIGRHHIGLPGANDVIAHFAPELRSARATTDDELRALHASLIDYDAVAIPIEGTLIEGEGLDTDALATALVAKLGDGLATKVADLIHDRLAS